MLPRQTQRFAVQFPVVFCVEDLSGEATVVNVSMEGCAILSESIPPLNSYVTLRIELPSEEAPLAIELGAVRWSTEDQFGVEFIRVESAEQVRLQKLVKTVEADPVI